MTPDVTVVKAPTYEKIKDASMEEKGVNFMSQLPYLLFLQINIQKKRQRSNKKSLDPGETSGLNTQRIL